MNPLWQAALGSIFRWLLTFLAGYFVQAGIWSAPNAEQYVTAAALALVALVLSLWQKYRSRVKIITALAMPSGATERQLDRQVASGDTPPVLLPTHVKAILP